VGQAPGDKSDNPIPSDGNPIGGEENTFDHMDDLSENGGTDPFEVLKQREEEGPPEIRTRLHSCQKPQNAAIRNMLQGFGVDLGSQGDPATAGQLFNEGEDALGGPNYASRTSEALTWTNSGATKFQDIFVMAAPEIIAAMPTLEKCMVNGVGTQMFEGAVGEETCVEDAISCLIGRPATPDHVGICNHILAEATDIDSAKQLAVAAMLAAAHTCE
jgi:hypothetical protein